VTRTPLSRSKVNLQGAYCGGLPHSLLFGAELSGRGKTSCSLQPLQLVAFPSFSFRRVIDNIKWDAPRAAGVPFRRRQAAEAAQIGSDKRRIPWCRAQHGAHGFRSEISATHVTRWLYMHFSFYPASFSSFSFQSLVIRCIHHGIETTTARPNYEHKYSMAQRRRRRQAICVLSHEERLRNLKTLHDTTTASLPVSHRTTARTVQEITQCLSDAVVKL